MSDVIMPNGRPVANLAGKTFGRLKVLSYAGKRGPRLVWLCQCDCGKQKIISGIHLSRGLIKSCGCLRDESTKKRNMKHGFTQKGKRTPEYTSWGLMISRCTNPKNKEYHNYGGRGIKVCERWRTSFVNFLFDVGTKPAHNYSIGRIDNNGNYEPGNVRWETPIEQGRNRRNNRLLTINGETKILAQWARDVGSPVDVIAARLTYGWSNEEAVLIPVKQGRRARRSKHHGVR